MIKQEDVNADCSIGQAVTVGRKSVIVRTRPRYNQQMSIRSGASSMRDGGLPSAIKTKSEA